jgi:hypothetical protein
MLSRTPPICLWRVRTAVTLRAAAAAAVAKWGLVAAAAPVAKQAGMEERVGQGSTVVEAREA